MTYLSLILIVLAVFTFAELLLSGYDKAKKQLFVLAYISLAVLVASKYGIGPDIMSYIPFYTSMSTANFLHYEGHFEYGFALFCMLCNDIGLSFWGMTCVVALLYFIPLYFVWRKIPDYRILALFALAVFDYNLMLYELRQCLAVAFMLWAFLFWEKKKYFVVFVCCLLSCMMHKSAVIIFLIAGVVYALRGLRIEVKAYLLLCLALFLVLVIPLGSVLDSFIVYLPFPHASINSLLHHLTRTQALQLVFPIYVGAILCLAYYLPTDKDKRTMHWMAWVSFLVIVLLFQYWFLLNRIRSYFLPFIIPYFCYVVYHSRQRNRLPIQLFVLLFLAFGISLIYRNNRDAEKLYSKSNNISTVFERFKYSETDLQQRQMDEAEKFWRYDYNDKEKW